MSCTNSIDAKPPAVTLTWPSDFNAVSVTSEIDFKPLIVVSLGSAGSCVVVVISVIVVTSADVVVVGVAAVVSKIGATVDVVVVVVVVDVEGAIGVAVSDAVDAFEVPTTFVAVTVKVYGVPFVNPVMMHDSSVTVAVQNLSGSPTTIALYEVIAMPPLLMGAPQETVD